MRKMEFVRFFEKVHPSNHLLESRHSLLEINESIREYYIDCQNAINKKLHDLIFNSGINPIFILAYIAKGMTHRYDADKKDVVYSLYQKYDVMGDCIDVERYIPDLCTVLTGSSVADCRIERFITPQTKRKLAEMFNIVKNAIDFIFNRNDFLNGYMRIFLSEIDGDVKNVICYKPDTWDVYLRIMPSYTFDGGCGLGYLGDDNEFAHFAMTVRSTIFDKLLEAIRATTNVETIVMLNPFFEKDMFIFECILNGKPSVLLPLKLQNKLFFKVIDDEEPFTAQDIFHLNNCSVAYEIMDDGGRTLESSYGEWAEKSKATIFAVKHKIDSKDVLNITSCNLSEYCDAEEYSFIFDVYSLINVLILNYVSNHYVSQGMYIREIGIVLDDYALMRDNGDISVLINCVRNIDGKIIEHTVIVTYHSDSTVSAYEVDNCEMYIVDSHRSFNVSDDVKPIVRVMGEYAHELRSNIHRIYDIIRKYFTTSPKVFFENTNQFFTELQYYYGKYANRIDSLKIQNFEKIPILLTC